MPRPQSFVSEFAPRLRGHLNSLLTPVIPPAAAQAAPASRTTKRGTVVTNYSEDLLADDDFEDSDVPRRVSSLRVRRDDTNQTTRDALVERLSKELTAPIEVQGIWRDWMGKPKFGKTDKQLHAQAALPLTLIPIRIDLDIPSFSPAPPLPLPADAHAFGVNPALPAYRIPEATLPYRLKDVFLWNLHETLITPDQFANQLVNELDLPNPASYTVQISAQIRQQLEEYAGVALHPLFQSAGLGNANGSSTKAFQATLSREDSQTPAAPSTPRPSTLSNGNMHAGGDADPSAVVDGATATASMAPPSSDFTGPDDTYRCIISINVNILNKLYTDRFEWSLLHPPGVAEMFAKRTCADMGLAGEWVPAVAHAIYEAVLRQKKEVCESGGLGADMHNDAVEGQEAGWRYDPEHLVDGWEPKVEILSKEEIEKREGDRERQVRRLRRERAGFSTATSILATPGLFDQPDAVETPMGRGERSKKKRRFRSLSPVARGGTPGGTPDVAGHGGGGGPTDWEKQSWRCSHCLVYGSSVWAVRDGPSGPRSLCNNCGLFYDREKRLPAWSKGLHRLDLPPGGTR